jgi:oligopeptide/dipeptide ABC transporter ATP-binding protein
MLPGEADAERPEAPEQEPPAAPEAPAEAPEVLADAAEAPAEAAVLAGPALLEVRDLRVHYRSAGQLGRRAGPVRAVDGVTLTLQRGATLGLVGESGSGKSTLARSLVRLEPVTSGEVQFGGVDILTVSERAFVPMRRRIQMVFQDSLNSLNPRFTLADTLAEPFIVHHLAPRAELRERVAQLLLQVGLSPDMMDQQVTQLSGGQRQRVNIARALAPGPELIIADEPTSALDVSVQAQILNLMRELQRQLGMSYLFISHDLGVVRRMASQVAVMYLGKVVETASREAVFARPLHPYTRALMLAAPRPDPRRERQRLQAPIPGEVPSASAPPAGCRFHPRCAMAQAVCSAQEPPLRLIAPGHWSACHFAEELRNPEPVAASGGQAG